MKLSIIWMYHDLMDLYGDRGNMEVLRYRCEKRGIALQIDTCGIGEETDLSAYDILFIGGGADREQGLLYRDLISRKPNIQKAMDAGTFLLLICGGYQFFGQYYIDGDGRQIEGLGFFDYYTEAPDRTRRCIGNIAVECEINNEAVLVVGFENHGGQTIGVKTPFGKVIKGHGNMFQSKWEGFYNGQVLGTYMHGPLLPKNPVIADLILQKGLSRRYGTVTLEPLPDVLEAKAREIILARMQIQK